MCGIRNERVAVYFYREGRSRKPMCVTRFIFIANAWAENAN